MDRHNIENGPMKMRKICAVLVMLWVKLVNFANFVMQIFVGKESNESTAMYRVKSRIPSCLFRYSLGSHLSRFSLASLICLCMLTVGVGNVWGTDTQVYSTGFESTTTNNNYQSTATCTSLEGNGASWSIYYGNFTTDAVISGSNCAQVRVYKNNSNYGTITQTSDISNVDSIRFSYKSSATGLVFDVQYSTNSGSSWNNLQTGISVSSSLADARVFKAKLATRASKFRLRILINSSSYHTSNSTWKLSIDDIVYKTISDCDDPATALSVSASPATIFTSGSSTLSTSGGNGSDITYTVTSDNSSYATISEGIFSATRPGTYSVQASQDDDGGTCGGTATVDITVRYQVKWSVNGNDSYSTGSPTTYIGTHNTKVSTLPTGPGKALCDGSKEFVGWTATPIVGSTNTIPTDLFTTAAGAPNVTNNVTYYAVFATVGTATFQASNITNTPATENSLEWAHTASSTLLKLSAGQRYIDGTPNTWTVTKGTSNYARFTAGSGKTITKIVVTISGTDYKIGSVTKGTLSTSSTTQTITGINNSTVDCKATSSYQICITQAVVTYASAFATSCCTPLASINGSVSWSNGSKATLVWDKDANATGYVVKWKTHAGAEGTYATTNVSSINDTLTNKKTCAIPSLTAGTEYDFKIFITGKTSPTVYCDKDSVMTAKAPNITASATLTGSDYAYGSGPGTEKSFTVSGVGLTGDITVTAPTNFEVSTTSGKSYSSSVVLSPSDGTLSSTTVYIRLAAGKAVGTYSASTVTISGGGAANNTSVTIAGTVSAACSAPTLTTPTLTSIASGTITVGSSISVGALCDVTDYGFVWAESSEPTISDNKTQKGNTSHTGAYSDGLSISFTTGNTYYIKAYATNAGGTTLSSALEVTPQSVTFNSNGGSSVTTKYVNNGGTVSKPSDPTKSNYDFDDWYTDDGTFKSSVDFSSTITDDVTYYANWTETLHDVIVEYKCGSTTVKASTTIKDVGVVTTGSTTAPNDITGYTWSTWSAMPSGVTTSTTPLTTRTITINATADSKTITANYTANQYAITYKDEGDVAYSGNNSGSLPSTHTYGSATALVNGAKSGYDFLGWYTDDDCTISAGASIGATAVTAAFTLYAKWAPSKYDVTLKKNGKTAAADQVVRVTYGSAMPDTIKAVGNTAITVPTQNGYTFKGYWDTSASTGGTQYYSYTGTPAALGSARNWDKTSDTNLFGRWEANVYTITLDANEGTLGETTSVTATFDQDMPTIATANLPTREGYRFDGFWAGKTTGDKYYNADGTSAKKQARWSADQKLYARWVAQTTFSVNGSIVPALTIDDNAAMPSATVPTTCGDCWAFLGWSEDSEESSAIDYASGDTHTFGEPTTLYAVFGQTEYKWVKNLSDLVNNEYYILTMLDDDDNERALTNSVTNTKYATATDIMSNLKENSSGYFIYNPDPSIVWKFTGTASSGRLYNESASKYLDLSSTSNAVLQASTSDNLNFTKFSSTLFNIASTSQTSHYLYMYTNPFWGVDDDHDGYASCYIYKRQTPVVSTTPNCLTYDIVWKVGNDEASGTPTDNTTTCTGIEDLPDDPDDNALDCATKFMGWSESVLTGTGNSAPADLFTTAGGAPKIDEDKTFHAVFASVDTENETPTNLTTAFTSNSWADENSLWTSGAAGGGYANSGVQIQGSTTAYATTKASYYKVDSVEVTYYTNKSSGQCGIKISVGSTKIDSLTAQYTTCDDGRTTARTLKFKSASLPLTGTVQIYAKGYTSSIYIASVKIYYRENAYKDYITTCCETPTFTISGTGKTVTDGKISFPVLREDLGGASTSTWAELPITISSNSSGTITIIEGTGGDAGKTAWKLSSWESRAETGGTIAATDHATFTSPSAGNYLFKVKTTTGQTGQGTYRISIHQAADATYCEATYYLWVDVTMRDKFVDNVNGNATINVDTHGATTTTPTEASLDADKNDDCHETTRRLVGWVKETDMDTWYVTGNSTRVSNLDDKKEDAKLVAPGATITTSGATWYAVWGEEVTE